MEDDPTIPSDHDYKLLAQATRALGRPIRLGPEEKCLSGIVSENRITLTFRAVRIEESSKRWHIVAVGMRMQSWVYEDGKWHAERPLTVWDESAPTYDIQLWGRRPMTRAERIKQGRWEQDCYRPGTEKQPMDSFYRESLGYAEGGVTAWRD